MILSPIIGNKELIATSGNALKVYSLSTGETLRSLSGHEGRVTCTQIVPGNQMQVMSSSPEDNSVICWDYVDGVNLMKKELFQEDERILRFAALNNETIFAQIVPRAETKMNTKLWRVVELEINRDKEYFIQTRTIRKTRGYSLSGLITGGKDNRYLVITSGRLLVWYDTKTRDVMKRGTRELITCCALHPTQECVATGEATGQISIWRRNTCSTLHWHAHAVSALSFTIDGTYLLSGGEEAVLVLWQLNTSKNTFIARLGAPIQAIATNNDASRYAVATKNNAIWVIDARSMQKDFRIRGLATQNTLERSWLKKLVYDPRTRAVIVKADRGTLQFYDIFKNRHVYTLDVTRRNYISRTEDEEHETWEVELVAVQGKRLATVERRGSQLILKFWQWKQNGFEMNTIVNQPHNKKINTLSFDPSGTLLVTSSMDRTFKIWEIKPDSNKEQWQCRSAGFYQDEPLRDAKFSQDGSLLGVVSDRTVSFWNPRTNSLLDRLTHPDPKDTVSQLELFSEYLMATMIYKKKIYVWDLLQKKVLWKMEADFLKITSHNQYLVVAEASKIMIFFHTNSTPQTIVTPNRMPRDIAFCPFNHVPIYSVSTGEIIPAFEEDSKFEKTEGDEDENSGKKENTRFTGLLKDNSDENDTDSRKRKRSDDVGAEKLGTRALSVAKSKEVLQTLSAYSSHVLPPISKLFDAFFETAQNTDQDNANTNAKQNGNIQTKQNMKSKAKRENGLQREKTENVQDSQKLGEEKIETKDHYVKFFKTLYKL